MKVKNIPTLYLTPNEQNVIRSEYSRNASPCLFVNCPEIDCDECPLHKANEAYHAYKHELEVALRNCVTEADED